MVKKLLYGLEKKYRILSLLAPLCMVGEVTMEIFIPFLISKIIDVGIPQKDIFYVMKFGGIMVLAACFSLTCGALCGRISSVAALGFSRNLRKNLFKRVQDFSFSNIDEFGTGSLVTRLTTDVTNIQNMYQNLIRTFIRAPLMLLSGSFMAFIISARLAMIFIVIIPLLAVLLIFIALKAYPRFRKMFRKYDELNTVVQENLIAIRVVKSFVRGDLENEKFNNIAEKLRDAQVRAEKIVIWNMPVMQLAIYFCIVASLWSGGNMIYAGSLTSGELISFITYITQILMSLMMLSMIFVQFIFSRASLARIMEVLNEESDIKSPAGNPEKIISDGSVEFKDVYFSYSGDLSKSALCGVNILIKSGSTVGILGGTGSSKSTFVSMIPRLYDVNKGAVLVGGKDVREYDLDSLRKEIGIVLQKNVLFKGTIAENLRWGNKNASYEDLVNACKIADADSFVSSFPEGYETDLGQGGVNLSGGQKQRLCIARAILKSPKILIMDDSTSACDTATEARILSAMKNSLPETTKIIIAQRISSVQNADFIIVMDGGKINGVGTHDELLKENSIYREVYESQMSKN